MSERGSFVTEYIYCEQCLKAVSKVLAGNSKTLRSTTIPNWQDNQDALPIIAGKIGGAYPGHELVKFEHEIIPKIEELICHDVRIAVIADSGQRIFTAFA